MTALATTQSEPMAPRHAPPQPRTIGPGAAMILAFPGREPSTAEAEDSRWPPVKLLELRQLWDMGLSHAMIAKIMDIGKGAVSGKLDRLGLERAKPVVDGRSFVRQPVRSSLKMADIPGRMVTMLQLTGCKAPTAERDGEHLFCDEPQQAGSCYCASHHAMAYRGNP